MKRVLLLADANSNHTRKWILLLKKQQIEVAVFSLYPSLDNWHQLNEVPLTTFYSDSKLSFWKKTGYLMAFFRAKKLINRFQPDVLNAHYATSYGLLGALLNPKKLILNFWGTDVFVFPKKSWFHKRCLQWIINRANVICSSSMVMSVEIRKYTQQEIILIPFGIDIEVYQAKPFRQVLITKKPIVLGIVKSLEPVYRIDIAIDAIKILNATSGYQFVLHIAGSGTLEKTLKSKSSNDIVFKGKIDQSLVPNFMRSLDLYINTTQFESFGVSTIEAMACGVPVIAHKAGGSAEIIENKKTGFLYSPNTPQILAETILEIIQDTEQLENITHQAYKHVLNHYSTTQTLKKLKEIF